MTDLEALKAAFLAKGGTVTTAPEGVAYGVSEAADRDKRAASREAERQARRMEAIERHAERRAESVREAHHTGGRQAALDALDDWS